MLCWKKIFIIGGLLHLLIWALIHHFNIKKVLCKLLLMCLIYASFHFLGTTRSPNPNFSERHLKIHLSQGSLLSTWCDSNSQKLLWTFSFTWTWKTLVWKSENKNIYMASRIFKYLSVNKVVIGRLFKVAFS